MERKERQCVVKPQKINIGEVVTLMGFVSKYRNLGNLIFIDLRDRTGIVQVSFHKTLHRFGKGKDYKRRVCYLL